MNRTWQALAQEAGLASAHLAIGVTALGKANYATKAYYYQAFFALSIGFERSTKLVLVLEYALKNNGEFPTRDALFNYGPNLVKLLDEADRVAENRKLTESKSRLPRSKIHVNMIKVLSDFASNLTRYYNLDFITSDRMSRNHRNPVHEWFEKVIVPILQLHYHKSQREKDIFSAQKMSALIKDFTSVRFHDETGEELNNVFDSFLQSANTEHFKSYSRMYMMQIARFLALLLSDLSYDAKIIRPDDIPYFSDYYAMFKNDDQYFRRRKTWSNLIR